jgi:methylmalonyl-CoA mutase N-terminal domain/subunit
MRIKERRIEQGTLFNPEGLSKIKRSMGEWERGVLKESLQEEPETKAEFKTGSNDITVKRLYTPLDIAGFDYSRDLGFPGMTPYTRGIHPTGSRSRVEDYMFYSGFGSSEEANKRYKELIDQGGTTISLALDLPTQLGYDSDDPCAEGEVGKVGVAVDSLDDMERIFEGIPLERIKTGTVGNCIGPIALSLFYALAEKRGIPPRDLHVHLQNDPFKEYTGRSTYIFPPDVALSLAADTVEFCFKELPKWMPQYACTTQMRWGGCSAAQEIAFGIANLITYIDAAVERGIRLEEFVPKLHFHATTDNDLFEEIAKFRAIRRLWAKIMNERYGTTDPRVLEIMITNWTGSHRLTAQQPLNNIVRTTVHILACLLGGVESIHAPAHDEALALPTLESTRLAQITKHILHYESGLSNTVDPLGGSYYVESLTDQIEKQALEEYKHVESMGGALQAIKSGYYLQEMEDGYYRSQMMIESGEKIIIGVNKDALEEESEINIFRGRSDSEERQKKRLSRMKGRRDKKMVNDKLAGLKKAANEKKEKKNLNIVPYVLEAIRAYCTVGEVCGVLRHAYGEYQPPRHF